MPPEARIDSLGPGRAVPGRDLQGRLDPFILDRMAATRREFIVREVVPTLTWNRLDIAIKLCFLDQPEAYPSAFAQELYDAHIHAFSLGDFKEPGNEAKSDAASFRSAFEAILQSMRAGGFDPDRSLIPVASDGSFINGGHRAACAMFLRQPVQVVETGLPPVRYDYRFFRSRGMSDDLLEAAVVAYLERSPRARVALFRQKPRPASGREIPFPPLVYSNEVFLQPNGMANLLAMLNPDRLPQSTGQDAPGSDQARSVGGTRSVLNVFDASDDGFPDLARQLGEATGWGNLVHVPASRVEALDLARLLLNERSIAFLNRGHPARFPSTADTVRRLGNALDHNNIPRETAVLGPEMVLAAYGVEEARQAEVLVPGPFILDQPQPDIVTRSCDPETLGALHDPRRHFHCWGLKFLTPAEAMLLIESRGLPESPRLLPLLAPLVPARTSRAFLYEARLRWARVRRAGIRAILRLGLREQAKWVQDRLRRW